ncbi:MAG TPA: ribosome assembly factor SBDS [Candidatus Nanoarchaeia archaeon]|nr:ribosome assembly factor SBDS [Candidatus Nanoarchaeia archaeon]
MVSVNDAHIVKVKSHGHTFEIMVDVNLALDVKGGKTMDIGQLLAVPKVYNDAKKGEVASPHAVKEAFGTDDITEVALALIRKGDIPLTTERKHEIREQKLKQIINIIHRNAVDPQTHLPHPPQRIENALTEANFHVNETEDVQRQVQDALKAIRPILPIKFEVKEIEVVIPAEYGAKAYPILQQFGKKLREDWQSDGSYLAVVEMPGGLEEDFHSKLNALCHGTIASKVLRVK